jgi:diaminopimelate decarboxylase
MDRAFDFIDHQICFAVKSNSNLAVLNVLAKLGAGFDIVTGVSLRVLQQVVIQPKSYFLV